MGKLDRSRYQTHRRVVVPISPNITLLDEHARLERAVSDEMREIREAHNSLTAMPRPPSADALAEVEARMDSELDYYVLGKIGYQAWLALQLQHPPKSLLHQRIGFDPETFPPVALQASCVEITQDPDEADRIAADAEGVEPGGALTADEAEWLFAELDEAQWSKLWAGVLEMNMGRGDAPKSAALLVLDQMSSSA